MRNCLTLCAFALLTILGGRTLSDAALAQSSNAPSLVVSSGHSEGINSIASSLDGRWLASGSTDSTIKIWDFQTGRLLRTLTGHTSSVSAVAISRDGTRVASASGLTDRRAIIWNPVNGEMVGIIPNIAPGQSDQAQQGIAFSRDGQSIFTVSYEAIRRWDVVTGKLVQSFPRQQRQAQFNIWQRFAISFDDRQIVAADSSQILLLDAASGRVVRSLGAHPLKTYNGVTYPEAPGSIVFSPDGELVAAAYRDKVKVYVVKTGKLLREFNILPHAVAFAPDSQLIGFATHTGYPPSHVAGLQLWDVQSGRLIRTLGEGNTKFALAFSADGRSIVGGFRNNLEAWDVAAGSPLPWLENPTGSVTIAAHSHDRWLVAGPAGFATWNAANGQAERIVRQADALAGPRAARDATGRTLVATSDGLSIKIWDMADGVLVRKVEWQPKPSAERPCPMCAPYSIGLPTLSPDGRWLVAYLWGDKSSIRVWDASSGRLLHTLPSFVAKDSDAYIAADDFVFSADGRLLFVGTQEGGEDKEGVSKNSVRVWDVATGKLLRTLALPYKKELPYAPSPNLKTLSLQTHGVKAVSSNERWLVTGANSWAGRSGDWRTSIALLDAHSGKLLREFPEDTSYVAAAAFSKSDQSILVGLRGSHRIKIWEASSGKLLRVLEGNPGNPYSLTQSLDGRRAIVGNVNGTTAMWDIESGQQLVLSLHPKSGEWLTMTPEGFFTASSPKAGEALSIIRGFELYTVEQVYQALFNPDVVREKLAGDPDGEVKNAAGTLDLAKVLDSGRAPQVTITSPTASTNSAEELITAQARIIDQDGGIGRIEWRVNGVTVGVLNTAPGLGKERIVTQTLALEQGENTIELVAYNGRNLLASLPVATTVTWTAPTDQPRSKLFVITTGINAYTDTLFRPLSQAVADAKAFGAAMKAAGEGLYSQVDVTYVLDADATTEKLEKVIDTLGAKTHPRDTFIFFAAAHGKSENGRFHLIPQDYRSSGHFTTDGTIGQDKLQDWFANRIKARRGLILLDTCESGALVGSRASGIDLASSEAAQGRLNEATGRPVLTAAAADQAALEGYKGHGVFTYALLDALVNGDTNYNGQIELSELAAHIQTLAPKLSQELRAKRGATTESAPKSRAAVALGDAPIIPRLQKPRTGSRGEDFPLIKKLTSLPAAAAQ